MGDGVPEFSAFGPALGKLTGQKRTITLGRYLLLCVRNINPHHCRTPLFGDSPLAAAALRQGERLGQDRPAGIDLRPVHWAARESGYCEHRTIALVVPACTRDCDSGCSGPSAAPDNPGRTGG